MKLHLMSGPKPGAGGINRGRGDAPMVWGDESPEQAVRFETEFLPVDLNNIEDSTLFGIGRAAPEAGGSGESAGLQGVGASSGSAVHRRRLSPRHRRAVGTFFGSPPK